MRLAIALAVLAGCGPALDKDFDGTWTGTTVLTLSPAGGKPMVGTGAGTLVVDVSGSIGEATSVCPNGSGALQFEGGGREVYWTGLLSCPSPFEGCPTAAVVFRSGTMKLQGERLLGELEGSANICPGTIPAKLEFSGTK